MSRFRFRLEAVRRLREAREKESAGELADAISEAGDADRETASVQELEERGRSQMTELEGDVARQRSVGVVMEHLARHKAAAERRAQEARGRVRERRAAFMEAVTERKAIDRLKERQQSEWDTDTKRREQKGTDEVNNNRHGSTSEVARGTGRRASTAGDE